MAHGVDATLRTLGLRLHGLYILSTESLESAIGGDPEPADLGRMGLMVEADYHIKLNKPLWIIASVMPKARYDQTQRDSLTATGTGTSSAKGAVYSFGLNIYPKGDPISTTVYPHGNIFLSLEYHIQDELDRPSLDNNRFIARLTGRF